MTPNSAAGPISPDQFFDAWHRVCSRHKEALLAKWKNAGEFTSEIFYIERSVTAEIAGELGLEFYRNYYSLDAIFFFPSDRVYCAPAGQTWVQNIRIAFEHENFFMSGLFQETSHLLITRADLRVVVSYPDNDKDLASEKAKLTRILNESDLARGDAAFLLITGRRIKSDADIEWQAFTHQENEFRPLQITS